MEPAEVDNFRGVSVHCCRAQQVPHMPTIAAGKKSNMHSGCIGSIDADELVDQIGQWGDGIVDALGESNLVSIVGTNDDAKVGSDPAMQPKVVQLIERDHGPLL